MESPGTFVVHVTVVLLDVTLLALTLLMAICTELVIVTVTAALVAVPPAVLRATAVKVWFPLASAVVSNKIEYG
jgi:hypothetical protein